MSTHKIDRRTLLALVAAIVTASVISAARVTAVAAEARKPNVLFIAVDDLRPQLGQPLLPQEHGAGILVGEPLAQLGHLGLERFVEVGGEGPRFGDHQVERPPPAEVVAGVVPASTEPPLELVRGRRCQGIY